jgi:hypothetical protein
VPDYSQGDGLWRYVLMERRHEYGPGGYMVRRSQWVAVIRSVTRRVDFTNTVRWFVGMNGVEMILLDTRNLA